MGIVLFEGGAWAGGGWAGASWNVGRVGAMDLVLRFVHALGVKTKAHVV